MDQEQIKSEVENFIGQSKLMSRKASFLKLFAFIFQNRDVNDFNIIETGTLRGKVEEHIPGDGASTTLWGFFCKLTGNKCYTVDVSPESIETSKFWTKEYADVINYVTQDSVRFLMDFEGKIDLLYLDSFDSPPDKIEQASRHQLKEIAICYDKLKNGTLILLDDAPPDLNGGKVKYSARFLKECGATTLYHVDTQVLFLK